MMICNLLEPAIFVASNRSSRWNEMRTANFNPLSSTWLKAPHPRQSCLVFLPREEMFGKKTLVEYWEQFEQETIGEVSTHCRDLKHQSKTYFTPKWHAQNSTWIIMDRVVPSDCIQESLGCSARSGHRGFQLIYQLLSFIGATNTCRNAIRMNEEHHVISCHLSTWFVSLAVEGKDLSHGKTLNLLCFNFPRRGQHSTLRSTRRMPGSLNQP